MKHCLHLVLADLANVLKQQNFQARHQLKNLVLNLRILISTPTWMKWLFYHAYLQQRAPTFLATHAQPAIAALKYTVILGLRFPPSMDCRDSRHCQSHKCLDLVWFVQRYSPQSIECLALPTGCSLVDIHWHHSPSLYNQIVEQVQQCRP